MPVIFPVLMPDDSIREQECLTVAELGDTLRCTKDAVYKKIHAGEWPYFKVIRRVYFTPDHVRQILALSEHRPGAR